MTCCPSEVGHGSADVIKGIGDAITDVDRDCNISGIVITGAPHLFTPGFYRLYTNEKATVFNL